MKRIGKAGIKMFNLPIKFYSNAESGGSSDSTTSTKNKKYEITITQPPEHEPGPDFIRGIPYAAKDNFLYCTVRKMTLDDYKEVKPEATEVPKDTYILQDINSKDLIITSDMIKNMIQMQLIVFASEETLAMGAVASVKVYAPKQYSRGKYVATLEYAIPSGIVIVKISDVDIWYIS